MTPTIGRTVIYHCRENQSRNFATELPAVIVRVFPDEYGPGKPGCNLRVFDDGDKIFWETSVGEGTQPWSWSWPVRA